VEEQQAVVEVEAGVHQISPMAARRVTGASWEDYLIDYVSRQT
jgi:hypothetical protein